MSISEANVFTDKDVTPQRMKTRYMQLMKKFRELDEQKIPHLLIVYCGGYGVTQMDKQIFLLNSNKKSEAIFRIEDKLRYFSTNFGTKLCALYDLT